MLTLSEFPYPGLRPFKREETDIFFGREEVSDQVIERLGKTHFLAVVGLSGCGKSSLVHTGMLAGLERGFLASAGIYWRVAEMRPGNRPFTRLAKTLLAKTALQKEYLVHFTDNSSEAPNFLEADLRRGSKSLHEILQQLFQQQETPLPKETKLLLIIDQFEELFRHYQQGDEDETEAFVNWLLVSSRHSSVYVIITMRSDFIGDCALFSDLPEAISRGMVFVPRLTREQLREAIEGPAKVFGGQVEPMLTNCLLNEMSKEPAQLPLLQHALMQMWKLASDEKVSEKNTAPITLTLKHYEKIGGLENALSNHADKAYHELEFAQQKIAEILFRRLCERDLASRDTRSPARLEEVAKLAEVSWQQLVPVVDAFRKGSRHFLTPPDGVKLESDIVIDINHESLIKHWTRLKNWTNEEADSANIYRRLEDSARRRKEKQAELLSGVELEIAFNWCKKEKPTAIWAKRYGLDEGEYFDLAIQFLEDSKTEQKRLQLQREKEEKRLQKLKQAWNTAIFAVIGFLLVTGLAIWGFWERHNAVMLEKDRTLTLFESQLTHATLLAKSEDYKDAKEILTKTRSLDPEIRSERRHARNLLAWFTELMGADSQQTYQNAGAPLFAVAVSTNGQWLATAGEKGTLVLFEVNSGSLLKRLQGHAENKNVKTLVFHPKNQWLASAGYDKKIILWSLPHGKQLRRWKTQKPVLALAVSPDGRYLASGEKNGNITLWDVENKQKLHAFKQHKQRISALAFHPSGELLASASYDGTAGLWQVETGQEEHRFLHGQNNSVYGVAFSPDGKRLATASRDKMVHLWQVDSGQQREVFKSEVFIGHQKEVFDVRFIANGDYLVSASRDSTLRVWDKIGVTLRVLQGHTASVNGIATINEQIFSASNDRTVRRWNAVLPDQQTVDLPLQPYSTAIAPEGNKVAVGFQDGSLRLYALPKSDLLCELKAHTDQVQDIDFHPNSTLLASASLDNTAKVWQLHDKTNEDCLSQLDTFQHQNHVNAVTFSREGNILATASDDGQVGLLTLDTREKRYFQAEVKGIKSVSIFVDKEKNQKWLLSSSDNLMRRWNLNQWQNDKPELLQEYKTDSEIKNSALSPDGQQIASVGRDQLIHLYPPTFNKFVRIPQLVGHESSIFRVIFSPDSQQIATVSADATLRLWDLENDKELFTLRLPTSPARGKIGVPLWDFDFRCTSQSCWIAVPLTTRSKLMLYELGKIYD